MKFIKRLFSPEIANKTVNAVIEGIDDSVLTPQERFKLRVELFKVMEPFKIVQRILMASICFVWVFLILNFSLSIWLGNDAVKQGLLDLVAMEFVWGPTLAGFSLYLYGGARAPKKE